MAALQDAFQESVSELGKMSSLWNPFAVIDLKGIEGHTVFSAILPRIIVIGMGIMLLMVLLRILLFLTRTISGQDSGQSVLGTATEISIIAALLVSYPDWIRLIPQIFTSIGKGILESSVSDLTAQISGALVQMGNESASDFPFWSAEAISITVISLLASLLSTIALVLIWVIAKLQAYLFTFWYLLGPIALPTLIFPPLSHICRIWFSTLLGVSFMSVTGPLLYVILLRTHWMVNAFAAGGEMDAITCLVFALLCLLTLVSVPVLSMKIWNGIESRVFAGGAGASDGIGKTVSILQSVATTAKSTYQNLRGGNKDVSIPSTEKSSERSISSDLRGRG